MTTKAEAFKQAVYTSFSSSFFDGVEVVWEVSNTPKGFWHRLSIPSQNFLGYGTGYQYPATVEDQDGNTYIAFTNYWAGGLKTEVPLKLDPGASNEDEVMDLVTLWNELTDPQKRWLVLIEYGYIEHIPPERTTAALVRLKLCNKNGTQLTPHGKKMADFCIEQDPSLKKEKRR